MKKLMAEIIETARNDKLSLYEMFLKLNEEVGELATSILVEQGAIKKKINEDSVHEAADAIIMILCVLMKTKDSNIQSSTKLVDELHDAMITKLNKYYKTLNTKE